jgi:hypothetical protein
VNPVPDPLLLRKSGSARNRIRDLWICSQELWPLDHRGGRLKHTVFRKLDWIASGVRGPNWIGSLLYRWRQDVFRFRNIVCRSIRRREHVTASLTWTRVLNGCTHCGKCTLRYNSSQKTLRTHNWTQTGKVTSIWTLWQKNEGSVEIKQRPTKMGDRTTYCHLKGHLFKLGVTDNSTCERYPDEDESATHILCDCKAIAYLRFRHLGQFFMEPSNYCDAPINRVLHIIRSVGLTKG